jgi:hypothetical protein
VAGLTTGATTLEAVRAILGIKKPLVELVMSKAPFGLVVPTPTCAILVEQINTSITQREPFREFFIFWSFS